jgi:hypothetical protein
LDHIDWEESFDAFDSNNLALLYQEQKSSGEDSTFSGSSEIWVGEPSGGQDHP